MKKNINDNNIISFDIKLLNEIKSIEKTSYKTFNSQKFSIKKKEDYKKIYIRNEI